MSVRASSAARSNLRERRRRARRRLLYVLAVLFVLLVLGALYGLQQPAVRINHVEVFGSTLPLEGIAREAMQGSYLGIVPRDSVFFYPERTIRERILSAYGDIATVSLFRNKLTGLTIRVTSRTPIARWCPEGIEAVAGTTTPQPDEQTECYLFDDSGLLFATSSEVPLVNSFVVSVPLGKPELPVRGQVVPNAELLPGAFTFARQLSGLGSPVRTILIEVPQATLMLENGTRLLYVLGKEQEAYTALVSAKNNLNLKDGSLEYADLRFSGKVYIKKRGESADEQ
jgi:cell division septal protein FtsQ